MDRAKWIAWTGLAISVSLLVGITGVGLAFVEDWIPPSKAIASIIPRPAGVPDGVQVNWVRGQGLNWSKCVSIDRGSIFSMWNSKGRVEYILLGLARNCDGSPANRLATDAAFYAGDLQFEFEMREKIRIINVNKLGPNAVSVWHANGCGRYNEFGLIPAVSTVARDVRRENLGPEAVEEISRVAAGLRAAKFSVTSVDEDGIDGDTICYATLDKQ